MAIEIRDSASTASLSNVLGETVTLLLKGAQALSEALNAAASKKQSLMITDIQGEVGFLKTLELVKETMSEERLWEVVLNVVRSLGRRFEGLSRSELLSFSGVEINPTILVPQFLVEAVRNIGPEVRVSKDEMSAWARIRPEYRSFFDEESIRKGLEKHNIVNGILDESIRKLTVDGAKEILVAKGREPVLGRDGYIEYDEMIHERNLKPQFLFDGSVSYKNIGLFTFVSIGSVLARRISAKPGTSGMTVTGREIETPETIEAEFQPCTNTCISDDGESLVAEIDGCVWKENGQLRFESHHSYPWERFLRNGKYRFEYHCNR